LEGFRLASSASDSLAILSASKKVSSATTSTSTPPVDPSSLLIGPAVNVNHYLFCDFRQFKLEEIGVFLEIQCYLCVTQFLD
jgi:hypothetical protein